MELNWVLIFCVLIVFLENAVGAPKNIVIIMADDLGYNDVSFHGSNEIPTPNIDALAYNGVVMDRFYTPPVCTPSRGSLMTGKWPFHIGLQHYVITNDAPWGLGLDEKIFPQYLKQANYATHLIGKWHLGYYQQAYTPTKRGYDSFYGYYGGAIDYFDHTWVQPGSNISRGLDFRRNLDVGTCEYGQYATDLFTYEAINVINMHDPSKPLYLQVNHLAPHSANDDFPLQAKKEDLDKFFYITDPKRRTYAAMVSALDQSVGLIVEALTDSGLIDNTIIAFYSDNGGPTSIEYVRPNHASNYPFRGIKGFGWEGAIRVPCILFAPWLPSGVIREKFMHVVDLLPTLISLAEVPVTIDGVIDGMNLSDMIKNETGVFRDEIVTIDQVDGISSLINKGYKLVNGSRALNGDPNKWLGTNDNSQYNSAKYVETVQKSKVALSLSKFKGPLASTTITNLRKNLIVTCVGVKTACNVSQAPCLFDIESDPCEEINLASSLPDVYASLKLQLQQHVSTAVPSRVKNSDPNSDPANFNRAWTSWQ